MAGESLWSWNNLAHVPLKSCECRNHSAGAESLTGSAICQDELLFLSSSLPEGLTTEMCCLQKTTVQSWSATAQAAAGACRLSACDKVCRKSLCRRGELVFDVAVAHTLEHHLPRCLAAALVQPLQGTSAGHSSPRIRGI